MNIYQKINEVRKALNYIQKDKSVSTGGGSYKAVTHDAVTALARKHFIDQGIVCVPNLVESHSDQKEDGAKQSRYRATYTFDFVNCDKPEDKITVRIEAHAMDNADKAPGKAISYAKKYAVLKLLEIETGEDEESRYQRDEIDPVPFVERMEACETIDELKAVYSEAFNAADGQLNVQKIIIAAKNNNKKRIENKPSEAAA